MVVFCSIVCLLEDVGEVEVLQCLVVSKGRGQTGLQGPLHVHVLAEIDEGSESGHTSSISFLVPGQLLRYELRIFKSEAYKKNCLNKVTFTDPYYFYIEI